MGTKTFFTTGYHDAAVHAGIATDLALPREEWRTTYTFENFFHPFVSELIQQLNRRSLEGMLDPEFLDGLAKSFFTDFYAVPNNRFVTVEHSPKEIDTSEGGPYSNYNWELFFHIPLTIAVHLSKNQRFAEAQRWFHYVFDPTSNDTSVPQPQRYWRFLAFRKGSAGAQIAELLALLSKPTVECTAAELDLKAKVLAGYAKIRDRPFQPHAVARTRHQAYMYSVVMKYLDNLIAWGDHLFRQDTIETINEASQLYVLASNILGRRPEAVPPRGRVAPRTYAQLKAQGLDAMGNALVELEGQFPFNLGLPAGSSSDDGAAPLFGIGRTLYFCVPKNDKLLGYWDTVADRLFKIRHCMNIAGVVRQLALFDPPLDPGMLVKAAAAGIDVSAIVAGQGQPTGTLRAQPVIQKATELVNEVRALGAALLAAIEKGDGERLAVLRQGHELKIQELQEEVRFLQWKQAQETTEGLLRTRASALERYDYYLRMAGEARDTDLAPNTLALDRRELTAASFDEAFGALVQQYDRPVPTQGYPDLALEDAESPSMSAGASGQGTLKLIESEADELSHLTEARNLGLAASVLDATASAMVFIPDIDTNLHYWGLGGSIKLHVGTGIQKVIEITSKVLKMTSDWYRDQASIASRTAGYERRADEWRLQANLAAHELRQIGRQILGSLISEQVARREHENVKQQIEQSREVDRFLREKLSNVELYGWMQSELSRLYYEYYRFAFDVARHAEATVKRELMRPELDQKTLIKFNYWDGGRKGLLSGEALHLDLKRLELAYHEHNQREYELTKHVSLQQIDPLALITLRATGRCTLRVPESVYDLDGPGHYFRRIKSVALSIPCVTGPYVGVHCKLSLLKSSLRKTPVVNGSYARDGLSDERFVDSFGGVQSVVVSSGQQDSGLFETNLRDERYLPFENAYAISEWQLELPASPAAGEPTQFDYRTIADVILHVRYTARDAGGQLRAAAIQEIRDRIATAEAAGCVRVFSMRHEFPSEWARFLGQTPAADQRRELAITLRPEHYPFWSQGRLGTVARVDLFAESSLEAAPATVSVFNRADRNDGATETDMLTRNPQLNGLLTGPLGNLPLPAAPTGDVRLYFETADLRDLWVAVRWGA